MIDEAKDYRKAKAADNDDWADAQKRQLKTAFEDLASYLHPKAIFLGLTRQIVIDFDSRGDFDGCKAIGIDPIQMVEISSKKTG